MAYPSPATLLTNIRARCFLDNASTAYPDARLLPLAQAAYAELYDQLVAAWGEDYFATSTATACASGNANVSLPATCYKLLGIDLTETGGSNPVIYQLSRAEFAERTQYQGLYGSLSARPRKFRVSSTTIILYPTPDAAYSLTIWYVPVCPTMVATSTAAMTLAGSGWDEYIIQAACKKVYDEQQMDSTAFANAAAEQIQRIIAMSPNVVEQPHHISRTRLNPSDMPRLGPYPWLWRRMP